MKQFISKLFVLAVVALGMVACTDADMGTPAVYNEHETLQSWNSEYIEDGSQFNLSFSENAAGDTICTMAFSAVGNTGKLVYASCENGTVSYDKVTGMSVINFAQSPFGLPLRVYAIRQSNQVYTTVQVFVVQTYTDANGKPKEYESKYVAFRALPGKPVLNSSLIWISANEKIAAIFDGNGKVQYEINGQEGEGVYTYDNTTGNGTITLADGSSVTISVNEKNQVVVTSADGTANVLFPSMA
uniref:hypothetical protein n=1 Tax=Alloprevotella sp. TaxID=1872471 RepID=UPI003FEF1DAE